MNILWVLGALYRVMHDCDHEHGALTWLQAELKRDGTDVALSTLHGWLRDGQSRPDVERTLERLHRLAHAKAVSKVRSIEALMVS